MYKSDKALKNEIRAIHKSVNSMMQTKRAKENIVKAHGGELKIETRDRESTVFTIVLLL